MTFYFQKRKFFCNFVIEFLQRQGNRLLKIVEAERCPKRVRLPILFSVASAHFCTLSTFSLPSITAISGQEAASRVTTSKSFFVIIALPSIRVPASSSTGYQPLILFGVEQPTVVTQITIGVS